MPFLPHIKQMPHAHIIRSRRASPTLIWRGVLLALLLGALLAPAPTTTAAPAPRADLRVTNGRVFSAPTTCHCYHYAILGLVTHAGLILAAVAIFPGAAPVRLPQA